MVLGAGPARCPGVRLIRHGVNRGYGEAVRTGFLATQLHYVFFIDADNQFDVEEIALLLPCDRLEVVAVAR